MGNHLPVLTRPTRWLNFASRPTARRERPHPAILESDLPPTPAAAVRPGAPRGGRGQAATTAMDRQRFRGTCCRAANWQELGVDDEEFGPAFVKVCSYAPWALKVCVNGHEWAKRQLEKEGLAYTSLDNGSP